ncbi:hypothetical protein [Mameliella alba]|uniref:hypothetical protein n=1 Tax=Mameliella alba TaxID=561184 RepID=UPI000B52C67E|nr:hypothetical protein [Mameliella alba]OWV43211.1 hypothetical protein CDZ95_10490 [Mameliella alba]BBU57417.1 hypothetical protein KU6B_36820 [Mameliella alba]
MAYPRSEKDARARSIRKLKALEKRARSTLYEIAGFFEEGPVSADIDRLLDDLSQGFTALKASMDDEVDRAKERA